MCACVYVRDCVYQGVGGLNFTHSLHPRSWAKDKAGKLFSKLPNLKVLDLSNAQIGYFQTHDFFSHNLNLAEIYLMGNKLETWNLTITHNNHLGVLDLRKNSIRHIDAKFRDELTTQHNTTGMELFLAGNDVDCNNCFSDYVTWLLTLPVVVDSKLIKYCERPRSVWNYCQEELSSAPLNTVAKDKALNIPDREVAAIGIGLVVTLAMLVVIGIVFNYRYTLYYHLIQKRNQGKTSHYSIPEASIYVSHSNLSTNVVAGKSKSHIC